MRKSTIHATLALAASVLAGAPPLSPLPPPGQDDVIAEKYRAEREERKRLNFRKRLPKGHPDRIP